MKCETCKKWGQRECPMYHCPNLNMPNKNDYCSRYEGEEKDVRSNRKVNVRIRTKSELGQFSERRNRRIVCLCGSTKFKDDFFRIAQWRSLIGDIVLMPLVFNHADNLELTESNKKQLDRLHKDKIKMADEIYIINKDGYIGDSTKNEINYAKALGKTIRYMEEVV